MSTKLRKIFGFAAIMRNKITPIEHQETVKTSDKTQKNKISLQIGRSKSLNY